MISGKRIAVAIPAYSVRNTLEKTVRSRESCMSLATRQRQIVARVAFAAFLIVLPATVFYGILFGGLINLPYQDDYDALMTFVNKVVQAKGAEAKIGYFLASQHCEYKLFFVQAVAWGQFAVKGRLNFAELCVLGDSAVLVLALILWRMFLPRERDLAKRLAFFVPVAWLLFQLQYFETLNWAMASLQNLWVLVFALGTIWCLPRTGRSAYASAAVLYVLAVATSGNGFFLLPIGMLVLLARRQWARAAGWLTISAVCIAAYIYHYNTMSSLSPLHRSEFSALLDFRPDYALAFIGNAAAIGGPTPFWTGVSLALGAGLLAFFGWVARRGYARRNPAVCCSVLFLFLTAVGVAGMRSDFGVNQSLESRYTIYGALFVIMAWTVAVEEFPAQRSEPLLQNGPYLTMVVFTVVFALAMDDVGYLNLAQRERALIGGMAAFERTSASRSPEGPVPSYPYPDKILTLLCQRARGIMGESKQLGVYEPPRF